MDDSSSDGHEKKPKQDIREIVVTLLQHGFELKEHIGSGGFASVYKVRNTRYNEIFCVKVISLSETSKKSVATSFETELNTLINLIHPNIISIFDSFRSNNCLFLILEYCPNGSLTDLIKERECIVGQEFIDIAKQMLSALAYCHSNGIAHRDIKPQNILLDAHRRPKLADFGLAEFYNGSRCQFGGSLPYMAPELVSKREFSPVSVDIWALGITFYQLLLGHLPWGSSNYVQEISSGFVLIPNDMEMGLAQLLRKMLDIDPKRRIPPAQLLQLPIFKTDENSFGMPQMGLQTIGLNSFSPGPATAKKNMASTNSILRGNANGQSKRRNQGSTIFSKKRIALPFTFLESGGEA